MPLGRFGTGALLPLTTLAGRYLILEKIAQGGMGAIYKAQDRRLQDKIVAVKEMSESAIEPDERGHIMESFRREAELLARLEHPNLVRVTDFFQEGERYYMVMEFINGRTLEKMLEGRTEPFPEKQVLIWADQLCDVLSYLHGQNPKIIYRDIKPANIMIVDGTDTVKLIDFGIARFYKPGKRQDTIQFGTKGYAPPEQYGKAQTDERSDIYALGALLHQLLTLRDPTDEPFHFPPVRSLNPKVSQRVEAAIAKAVQHDRQKRHQSVEEMRAALLGSRPAKKEPARPPVATPAKVPASPPAAAPAKAPAVLSFDLLDFGKVMTGGIAPARAVEIPFPSLGEELTFRTDVPWIHIHPQSIRKSGEKVTITLDTARLKPGRLHLDGDWLRRWVGWHTRILVPAEETIQAQIEVTSSRGQVFSLPVRVTVVPQPEYVFIGWVGTVLAMLVEVAIVLAILMHICGALPPSPVGVGEQGLP